MPIVAKISKIDKNEKDNVRLVVICSATESVRWSWVVKNGFIALRYRKVGNPTIPELAIPTPDKIIDTKRIAQLRIFVRSLLNFIIIPEMIIKIVGKRISNPAYPIMNEVVLSNASENNISDIENAGAAHMIKFSLFFKNGNAK